MCVLNRVGNLSRVEKKSKTVFQRDWVGFLPSPAICYVLYHDAMATGRDGNGKRWRGRGNHRDNKKISVDDNFEETPPKMDEPKPARRLAWIQDNQRGPTSSPLHSRRVLDSVQRYGMLKKSAMGSTSAFRMAVANGGPKSGINSDDRTLFHKRHSHETSAAGNLRRVRTAPPSRWQAVGTTTESPASPEKRLRSAVSVTMHSRTPLNGQASDGNNKEGEAFFDLHPSPPPRSAERGSLTESAKKSPEKQQYLSKDVREENRRNMAKDREKRMVNNRKRREKLEMQRARDLKSSTSAFRRDRAKKQTIEEKARVTSVKGLCTCVVLASRIQNAAYIIQQYRDERQMVHMQNFAAKLIARRSSSFPPLQDQLREGH